MRITMPFYVDYSSVFESIRKQGEYWTNLVKAGVAVDPSPKFEKPKILNLKAPTQTTGNHVNILA